MKNNPVRGLRHALEGLGLIFRPGLRRFVVVPLVVNVLVFSLLIWGGIQGFGLLMQRLLPEDAWWSSLSWLLWPLFALTTVLIVFYTFTALANLIAAPFNGLLAEKVEIYLSGHPIDQTSGWRQLLQEFLPSLLSELRKLLYFVVRAIPLLVLFLIPGLNLAAPFLWLAFNAWYLALEYGDYPMGNHGILFREQHGRLKRMRLTSLGFGAGVSLLMLVPGLNFLAMPAGVAGATVLWHRELAPSAAR
jgi:CysZ protein